MLLREIPFDPIKHGRGLRKGDPLSPLLFDLAIDPVNDILHKALSKVVSILLEGPISRTSIYVDDTAAYITPIKEDM